jgi:hypothetical protein
MVDGSRSTANAAATPTAVLAFSPGWVEDRYNFDTPFGYHSSEMFEYAMRSLSKKLAAMGMELGFGLLVNRPDEDGNYPYWDNSELPLNIFKQAWLVNDLVIGAVAVVHVWLAYPLLCKGMSKLSERAANAVFAATVGAFAAACVSSYSKLIKDGHL